MVVLKQDIPRYEDASNWVFLLFIVQMVSL